MSAASLPMYDLPEIRPAQAALWAGLARHIAREGVADVPAALACDQPIAALWSRPDLLLSQCCGYDLVHAFAGALRPLATPCHGVPGCAGPSYSSIVVVAEDSQARSLDDLRGGVCAINSRHSHSGMNALRALIAPLSRGGRFFRAVRVSGAHSASIGMVARGEADVAAIDCVVHALLARHRPAALERTRPLARTPSAVAPPFVTPARAGDDRARRLRAALVRAFDDPALAAAREDLLLAGIEIVPISVYVRIKAFERYAARHGYPVLA
ncbi:MAG TPA: PhnD/SsuA/transferrin family substrate-binding protein [Geminicoccaceae bacterium]|nr:PhnD/SsuA/transferrin family substrate-binding protein [Geminicoccaceae bacterium]